MRHGPSDGYPDDDGGDVALTENFKCATCGKIHQKLPRSFAADFPDMYANMKRVEKDLRAIIGSDQCVVDQQWFFIRGCLEIPVIGSTEPFIWGLWASVREEVFDEVSESWEEAGREGTRSPFKGRLANSLAIYADTLNVKIKIQIQPLQTRPLFVVEQPGHPPAIEQQKGISEERAQEIASLLLHQERFGWPAKSSYSSTDYSCLAHLSHSQDTPALFPRAGSTLIITTAHVRHQ